MGYLKRTSNYLEGITLFDPTYKMSVTNHVAVGVNTLRIYTGCSLEKEFIELIRINL